jgi:hypothetical protein
MNNLAGLFVSRLIEFRTLETGERLKRADRKCGVERQREQGSENAVAPK